MVLALLLLAQADAPTQIHIAYGSDASSQMTITWRTSGNLASQVKYGLTDALDSTATATTAAAPNSAGGYIHSVTLTGLQGNAFYYYSCGSSTGGFSAVKNFKTAPPAGTPYTIIAYGDAGTSTNAQTVQSKVKAANPDLVLMLGDLSYANGTQSVWDTWFNQLQPVADHIPSMPCIGNHETYGGDITAYLGRFTLPNNERWYSFVAADVYVLSVDCMSSTAPGSAQYQWIANDLAQSVNYPQIKWRIAMFHYAPYTSGTAHPTDGNALKANLSPLFDAYHVDLALAGHVHNYERSHPVLDGGVIDSSGTIHIVAGTGGTGLYTGWNTQPAWSVNRGAWHGYTKIEIDGSLVVTAIKLDGTVMDTFTIAKPAVDTLAPVVKLSGSTAKVRDNVGVTKVEFYANGALLATDTVAPFESAGADEARAYDAAGNVGIAKVVIATKSTWKYHDLGQDLGTAWRTVPFDDSSWSSGAAVLGYGESYVATTISYGSSSTNKHPMAYFRKTFDVSNPGSAQLTVTCDDGFVAYLNGVEVARWNYASGTYATSTVEPTTKSFAITGLASGSNVLCVEVRQSTASSSDLIFDAELTMTAAPVAVAGSVETSTGGGGGGGGCGFLGIEVLLVLLYGWRRPRGVVGAANATRAN